MSFCFILSFIIGITFPKAFLNFDETETRDLRIDDISLEKREKKKKKKKERRSLIAKGATSAMNASDGKKKIKKCIHYSKKMKIEWGQKGV